LRIENRKEQAEKLLCQLKGNGAAEAAAKSETASGHNGGLDRPSARISQLRYRVRGYEDASSDTNFFDLASECGNAGSTSGGDRLQGCKNMEAAMGDGII